MISSTVIVYRRTGLEQNLSATLEDLTPSLSSAAECQHLLIAVNLSLKTPSESRLQLELLLS